MAALKHYADIGMDALRFYKNLLTDGSKGAYFSLACAGFALLLVFFFMIIGYQRGASRETMRFLTAGVSVVAAFLGACVIGRASVFGRTVGSFLPIQRASLAPLAEATLAELALPFVFVILFLVLNLLAGIPHVLLCGILGFSYRRNNAVTRIVGMLVGALHGLFISVVILLPVFGLVKPYVDIVKNPEPDQSAVVSFYDRYLEKTAESPLYRYAMRFGGDKTLRELEEGNLADLISK